jgi:NAD(P)-dependent dehydrogenase (short-subunit alcohol dehydrogenase family)
MASYPELGGKVAIISGAAGNLGEAVVRRLQTENVKLALIDRNEPRLKEMMQRFDNAALIGVVDLTKKDQVDPFIDKVIAHFGKVDILVNTTGGYKPGAPVHEMDEALWNFMIDLNAKTAFLLNSSVARAMLAKANAGRLINIAGKAGLSSFGTGFAYSAGKSAVLRMTEAMSQELLKHGITVNAILPSTIDTPQNRESDPKADFSKWVKPESIADVIAFLCSDSARDISGAAIPVYGRA